MQNFVRNVFGAFMECFGMFSERLECIRTLQNVLERFGKKVFEHEARIAKLWTFLVVANNSPVV